MHAFREMLTDAGIESSADHLLKVFLDSSTERMMDFQKAARSGNLLEAGRLAHLLRSGAGSIFAVRLAELLRQAEEAAHESNQEQIAAIATEIAREYERASTFIGSQLAGAS